MTAKYFTPKPEATKRRRDGKVVCQDNAAGKKEYRRRTLEMVRRQRCICPVCTLYLFEDDATFDHEIPRGHGGGSRDDRIWIDGEPRNFAVHGWCNTQKGSKRDVIRHHDYERKA